MKDEDIVYFEDLNQKYDEAFIFRENEDYASDEEDEEEEGTEKEISDNIPFNGSPLYPRVFIGESAKPLMSEFNDSGYVDDNITRTYLGLLSFYG